MELLRCPNCGKEWAENYCPECGRTIDRGQRETAGSSKPPPIPRSIPPPLPPTLRASDPFPGRIGKTTIAGVAGLTVGEVQEAVARGGRFVVFQFCISVFVMTFKRSSPLTFIKPGESAVGKSAPFSLMSLFLGWWGIPWGPIWTISTLVTNLGGGKDLTREIMSALGAPAVRPAVSPAPSGLSSAPPVISPAPPVLSSAPPVPISPVEAEQRAHRRRMRRLAWVGAAVVVLLGTGWLGYRVLEAVRHMPQRPGEAEFQLANGQIGPGSDSASGNTQQAVELARLMSGSMKRLRDLGFEQTKEQSWLDEKDVFRTYCELRQDTCVFLVHVPELRRFTSEAQNSLGELAWHTAQTLLERRQGLQPGARLAVGLRGIAAYDRVILGTHVAEVSEENTGIQRVVKKFGCDSELYSWFLSPAEGTNSNR